MFRNELVCEVQPSCNVQPACTEGCHAGMRGSGRSARKHAVAVFACTCIWMQSIDKFGTAGPSYRRCLKWDALLPARVCRRRLPSTVELGSVRHTADRIDRGTFVLTGSQRTAGGHQTRAQLLPVKCGSKCRAKPASRTWAAPACASKAPGRSRAAAPQWTRRSRRAGPMFPPPRAWRCRRRLSRWPAPASS